MPHNQSALVSQLGQRCQGQAEGQRGRGRAIAPLINVGVCFPFFCVSVLVETRKVRLAIGLNVNSCDLCKSGKLLNNECN